MTGATNRWDEVNASIAMRPSKTCDYCQQVKPAVEFNPLKRGGSLREAITPDMEKWKGEALTQDGLSVICDPCYTVYKRDYPANVAAIYAGLFVGVV